eukprot:GHVS01102555.1.p1 GENE.GHVS01102555.1~~GHVS01102555.1.p1  ORF type:complete len:170 (+),score=22.94 GHVS01102555.1:66-512(+)
MVSSIISCSSVLFVPSTRDYLRRSCCGSSPFLLHRPCAMSFLSTFCLSSIARSPSRGATSSVSSSPPVLAAGVVIIRRRDSSAVPKNEVEKKDDMEFLMLKSSREKNHWTPPKGHLDSGDSSLSCALREVFEECGLELRHLALLPDKW